MREIKFRAWDKNKKIMIYDYDLSWANHYNLTIGDSLHNTVWVIGHIYETLMQFTGLKDKSGNDIYEGDIVEFTWLRSKVIDALQYVELPIASGFQLMKYGDKYVPPSCAWKIIGNIYENVDLLEAAVK